MYCLANDHLNFYTPQGLTWLFYFLTIIYFLPRTRKEMLSLVRGSFVRVLNAKGEVAGVLHIPKGLTKKDRGNVTMRDAAGYYKR